MDVRVGPSRRLSTEELMLLNCGVGEDSWDPLGQHGDQTINPKGNQLWIFIERTDAEAEAPILWPPHAKSWLIGKDPDAGKEHCSLGSDTANIRRKKGNDLYDRANAAVFQEFWCDEVLHCTLDRHIGRILCLIFSCPASKCTFYFITPQSH